MADTGKNLLVIGLLGGAAYLVYEWWKQQQTVVATPVQTPGQTPTMVQSGQPTSITTTATSTPTTSTTAQASQPAVVQPTATDLQKQINMTLATADQWNYAYRQLVGYGIEQVYGASFDGIYGAVQQSGQRSSGQITANAFLSMPAMSGFHPGTVTSGTSGLGRLGAIATFYTPVINSVGSMVYRSQHPSPYRFPQTAPSGMGAFTQPTGFETALYAGLPLRSNRIR